MSASGLLRVFARIGFEVRADRKSAIHHAKLCEARIWCNLSCVCLWVLFWVVHLRVSRARAIFQLRCDKDKRLKHINYSLCAEFYKLAPLVWIQFKQYFVYQRLICNTQFVSYLYKINQTPYSDCLLCDDQFYDGPKKRLLSRFSDVLIDKPNINIHLPYISNILI